MHIIGQFLWILAAWRWGDWRNWKKYHATILYMVTLSLLYEVLTYNYTLWAFRDIFLPTHILNSLAVTFVGFPCSVLLFLSRFPKDSIRKKLAYIFFWIVLYLSIEYFFVKINEFYYKNGWNFIWSIVFDTIMFPMLLLHHKKPLLAYLFSVPLIILYMLVFKVPIGK